MKEFFKFFDKFTFLILLMLAFTGIVLIYSAAHTSEQSNFTKQLLWLLVAVTAFFVIFKIKTEAIFNLSFVFYVILVGALVLQIGAGRIISGTKS